MIWLLTVFISLYALITVIQKKAEKRYVIVCVYSILYCAVNLVRHLSIISPFFNLVFFLLDKLLIIAFSIAAFQCLCRKEDLSA